MSGTTQIFTDRPAFLAALAAGYVVNTFNEVPEGASGGLNYTDGDFQYLVYPQIFSAGALYNGSGFVSTDHRTDKITVQFLTDAPVTAIGGNFWGVNFSSLPANGTIDLLLSDGSQETIQSGGPDDFRGFITNLPIFRLTIDAPDVSLPPAGTSPDRWPTMDNLIIGNAQ